METGDQSLHAGGEQKKKWGDTTIKLAPIRAQNAHIGRKGTGGQEGKNARPPMPRGRPKKIETATQ